YGPDLSAAAPVPLPGDARANRVVTASYSTDSIVLTDQGAFGWGNDGRSLGLSPDSNYYDASTPHAMPYLDGTLIDVEVAGQYIIGLTAEGDILKSARDQFGMYVDRTIPGATAIYAGPGRTFLVVDGVMLGYGYNRFSSNDIAYNLLGIGIMCADYTHLETYDSRLVIIV